LVTVMLKSRALSKKSSILPSCEAVTLLRPILAHTGLVYVLSWTYFAARTRQAKKI